MGFIECPKCKKSIDGDYSVCPHCGSDLNDLISLTENNRDGTANEVINQNAKGDTMQNASGMGRASLILGIVSIVMLILGGPFVIPCIVGLVLSFIAKRQDDMSRTRKAGMIINFIITILWIMMLILAFYFSMDGVY